MWYYKNYRERHNISNELKNEEIGALKISN